MVDKILDDYLFQDFIPLKTWLVILKSELLAMYTPKDEDFTPGESAGSLSSQELDQEWNEENWLEKVEMIYYNYGKKKEVSS